MDEPAAVVEPLGGAQFHLCEECRATAGEALVDRNTDSTGAPF